MINLLFILSLFFFSIKSFELELNDTCVSSLTNKSGKCVEPKNCDLFITHRDQLNICSFIEKLPIICCPNSGVTSRENSRRISIIKCEEILNNTQNEQFIVGGEEAIVGEFPHMTAIGSTEGEKIFWICGASLISEKFILTAAHCVSRRTLTLPELIARVTDQKLNRNNEEIQPNDFGIKKIIVHPDYRSRLKYNDIALMELDKEAIFSIDLRPACLYQSSEVEETVGQAIGWGAISYAGQYSDKLLKGDLNFVSNFECNKSYNEEPDHLPFGIISTQVCAGDSTRQRDTCQGDSGGPLQVLKYRKEDYKVYYEIIGITSFGQFCASGSPSVYTRVSSYLDWIEGIVWPDSN